MKFKITNISNVELAFHAEDGTSQKMNKMMSGLREIGYVAQRYHVLKPGQSVISVSTPEDKRFKIEPYDESKEKKETKTKEVV